MADLKEGVRYVWSGNRAILVLITLSIVPNLILQPVTFLLPVFTTEVLGRDADVGGFLLASHGFGGLVAAFGIASVGFIFRRGMVCLVTALLSSVLAVAFAFSAWLPVAFVVIALHAFSQSTYRTTAGTLIQTLVPDELRSRVTSLQRYSQGFVVLTSLLIGWYAGEKSVPFAISVAGIVGIVVSLAYLAKARRIRELA